MRIQYRIRQFWNAIHTKPTENQIAKAREVLSPGLFSIFLEMQASEQVHSLSIFETLLSQGETNQDLLSAALLHDVGKNRYRLHSWERVLIVLGRAIIPRQVFCWGQGKPSGWKRAFVIAEKHPTWGAEMVAEAGASNTVVELIRRHQMKSTIHLDQIMQFEDQFLQRLQMLDDNN